MTSRPAEPTTGIGSARAGLTVLALAGFTAVTTEMVPVGLLPQIGHSLHVGDSAVGQLISLYAVMVAVLSVPLTWATRRLPRKPLLLLTVAGYATSNVIVALSPSFALIAVGRGLGGLTHALFFSVCIGYAARLVPAHQTGRALAFASTGASAGFVLGVPLATSLGEVLSWRTSFAVLALISACTVALVALVLPSIEHQARPEQVSRERRRQLGVVVTADTVAYLGQSVLYTYLSVLLLDSGAAGRSVGPIMLLLGVSGLLGVWLVGVHLDRRTWGTSLAFVAAVAAGIAGIVASIPTLALVLLAGAVWSVASGALPALFQNSAVRAHATTSEMAGAWINAASNVGIAGGAAIGGVALDGYGIRTTAGLAAVLVAGSAVIIAFSRRAFPSAVTPKERSGLGRPGAELGTGA